MKNKYLPIIVISFLLMISEVWAQVGIGTTTPNASAMLDITSTTQGLLAPRMTTIEKNAIASPANGLLVFDTDENIFYFYNGVSWVKIIAENSTNDYTGWGDYVDVTRTSAAPLNLIANVKITLPNDANTIRDSQKPIDITGFYDSTNSTITGRDGDGLNVLIEFK